MASNFEITVDKISDGFGLVLEGDFDATSAYELIYAIKKLPEDTLKISIYTNGLENIYPFGLDVFSNFMSSLNGQSTKIVFTGNNASQLSLGNPGLTSISHFWMAV
jgi:anti-anti-sigma regulatory factor